MTRLLKLQALRISMEEEKARQEKLNGPAPVEAAPAKASTVEDDMLAQALAMSLGGDQPSEDVVMEEISEEEQMRRAIAMSMGEVNAHLEFF